MIAVDASVLIAHLWAEDAHHDSATRLLIDTVDQPLVAHSLTMAEVLVGGVRAGRGTEMQADLRAIGVGIAQHSDDEPLQLATLRATTGLRLPDCCVLHTAQANDATLATFDQALTRAARHLHLVVAPVA